VFDSRRRRRFLTTTGLLGIAALLCAAAMVTVGPDGPWSAVLRWRHGATRPRSDPTPSPTPTTSSTAGRGPLAGLSYPATGPGTYVFAEGQSAVFGTGGPLQTYRVAAETDTPVPADEFALMVDLTLSDPRSWIAGGDVRLQRVSGAATGYTFTIYLVTPGTAYKICLAGGFDISLHGEPYTSCRVGGKVVINIARYLHSVPGYGAPLEAYQQYAINHEVGHALGHDHELCPGRGKLAPVMLQQTFSLQGCIAYSWPYLNGKRYEGPPKPAETPEVSAPRRSGR
jgi:Protein of unknown function (DUF3152)